MKYTLTVNQKQALELGIKSINQAIVLGLIAEVHSWAEPVMVNGEIYYWTARQKIVEELKLLQLKPDTVYRHLKSLAELNLIDYIKDGKKDCVRLTKLGKSYYVGNESEKGVNSEMNPSKFGNESEKDSEMNPTYKNTKSIRATKDTLGVVVVEDTFYDSVLFQEYIDLRKKRYLSNSRSVITRLQNKLKEYANKGFNPNDAIMDAITGNWKDFYEPKNKPVNTKSDVNIFDVLEQM